MKRPFNDIIKVHIAPSGTQWVDPLDIILPIPIRAGMVKRLRREMLIKNLRRMAG